MPPLQSIEMNPAASHGSHHPTTQDDFDDMDTIDVEDNLRVHGGEEETGATSSSGGLLQQDDDAGQKFQSRGRLCFTDFLVKFPCVSLVTFLTPAFVLAFLGLSHTVGLVQQDKAFDVSVSAFQIRKSHFSQQRHATHNRAVNEEYSFAGARRRRLQAKWVSANRGEGFRDYVLDRLEIIMYWQDGRNMLTPEGLGRAHAVERAIEAAPGFHRWCSMDAELFGLYVCAAPTSVTTYFFPSARANSSVLVYDGRGESIVDFMGTHRALRGQEQAHWFLSDSKDWMESSLLRTEFVFAMEHLPTAADRAQYREWMRGLVPILEEQTSTRESPSSLHAADGFRCAFGGSEMTPHLINEALFADLKYAIGSALLVLLYTIWRTDSVLLAVLSLGMIVLSFPVSFFFYYTFCTVDGNEALGILNILGVYVILGIGVDDVYVFLAAFEQCKAGSANMEERLGRAYTRAAKAMLTTSA